MNWRNGGRDQIEGQSFGVRLKYWDCSFSEEERLKGPNIQLGDQNGDFTFFGAKWNYSGSQNRRSGSALDTGQNE